MATPIQTGSYQVFSPYAGTDSGCTSGVFLFPPAFFYNQQINLVVRLIYTGGTTNIGNYTYSNADFQFALMKAPQDGNNNPTEIDVSITVVNNNVWKCAPSARQSLMANFIDFITQIEAKFEINSSPILSPGATSIIAAQIAENLPAPIAETLFYRCGFNSGLTGSGAPSVNLTPGMRLRIEFESSQYLSPGSPFNSYISDGQFYYYVCSVPGSNNQRLLAFDPFLGQIAAPKIQQSGSAPFSASGIIDLESAGMARRYFKLVYPQNMIAGNLPGDSSAAKNIVLTGANNLSDLSAGAGSAVSFLFRGRTIVIPEIPVYLSSGGQRTLVYVPVGTTVANLLERFTAWKPLYFNQQVVSLSRLQAAPGMIMTNSRWTFNPAGNQSISYKTVQFLYNVPNTQVGNIQSYDLPLVSGDLVTVNFG